MIEQHQMLVNLSHITDVRHDADGKLCCHDGDGEILADASQASAICLNDSHRPGLKEILPKNAIRNRLPNGDGNRGQHSRQRLMPQNVIGLGGFFNPVGVALG